MSNVKDILNKCIIWINECTSSYLKKQSKNQTNTPIHYSFRTLTPTDDVDMRVYEDALNYAFEDKEVKNIALSGSYGSGKSSVLKSYTKKHKALNFMHISLAHFEEANVEEENSESELKCPIEGRSNTKSINKKTNKKNIFC